MTEKIQLQKVLMDASALEISLRCSNCQQVTSSKARDWNDATLERCPHCGDRWADAGQVSDIRTALVSLKRLVQLSEGSGDSAPFTVLFGATRMVR